MVRRADGVLAGEPATRHCTHGLSTINSNAGKRARDVHRTSLQRAGDHRVHIQATHARRPFSLFPYKSEPQISLMPHAPEHPRVALRVLCRGGAEFRICTNPLFAPSGNVAASHFTQEPRVPIFPACPTCVPLLVRRVASRAGVRFVHCLTLASQHRGRPMFAGVAAVVAAVAAGRRRVSNE